jgi:hypothetical protein
MRWRCVVRGGLSILILGLAAGSLSTCTRAPSDPLLGTVFVLDRAIDALTDRSSDFRTVLQGLTAHLPPGADGSVGAAIDRFLDRAPGANADFHCSTEFVRLRARKELIRIEETLLGIASAPAEPQFCYAAPFVVDLSQPSNTVEIYGYDFDRVRLEMFLVTDQAHYDVSSALIPRTHYHVTLVLGDHGVRLSPKARLLGLTWGNLIHHAIPIVQPHTLLCSCIVEEIAAGHTVELASSRVRRDRSNAAGSAGGWANVLLDYQSNALGATVCMTVTAPAADGSLRTGCVHAFVLTVDPDRTIEWVFGRLDGRASYASTSARLGKINVLNDRELIRSWTFAGFGEDADDPRVTVELGKLRLVTTGGERCVSPIAYLEARRTGAISAVTSRGLDRQLANVVPEIRELRPRFAPAIR